MRVAVIGGGVIGLTTAYALIRQGHEVDLIERRDEVGLETSFANGGQLSYRYVSPLADAGVPLEALGWMLRSDAPLRFRPQFNRHQWSWCLQFLAACRSSVNQRNTAHLLRLALHSQKVLRTWREQDRLDNFAWRSNGKLVVYREADSWAKASKAPADDNRQLLSAEQCLETEPALAGIASELHGGVYAPGDEVGDCYRFCQQLLKRLQANSAFKLHANYDVKGLRISNGRVKALQLNCGDDHLVDHLVVAAGVHSLALLKPLGIDVPLYPLKGYSLSLQLEAGKRETQKSVPETNVTDYDNKVVYARLDDQLRVAAMVDVGGWDSNLDARRIKQLRDLATLSFPDAGNFADATAWAGLRPATPQGTPWLGASGINNLWLNLGHGSLGFTLACGSADVLANLIDTAPSPICLDGLTRT
ncbi:D-amino acid dehydrogenase [Pseudomonas sp. M30-35]|uniref:D-amino acid dehydrogenase n=1 Tax=Pseudomonas sp. M30-35 TaxID=1981174 RepID=UPI000B3CB47B|nr:D-amino acid dehydrogenase [Pseudomonas sp. M30-35]ARU88934.1 amino acid dehydrogenase [Pseudomonas sp. M30-35]